MREKIKQRIKKKRLRWRINDELIMHYEASILLVLLIVSVTIAWLTLSKNGTLIGLSMSTSKVEPYLYISSSADGEDITEDNGVTLNFSQLNQTRLMPGTEGSISIYVTSLQDTVTGCSISLNDFSYTYTSDNITQEQKDKLAQFVPEHIRFYYPDALNETDTYRNQITKQSGYIVPLTKGETKEVTLYWIWPYSYAQIPYVENPESEEAAATYDLEDSWIGGMIKDITFQFDFSSMLSSNP